MPGTERPKAGRACLPKGEALHWLLPPYPGVTKKRRAQIGLHRRQDGRGEGRGQSCCKGGTGGDPGAFIDHVCGMSTSDPEAFIPYEYQGKTYHFCCKACVERFRKDPEKFIRRPGPSGMPSKPGAPPAGGADPGPLHPPGMLGHPGIWPFCGNSSSPLHRCGCRTRPQSTSTCCPLQNLPGIHGRARCGGDGTCSGSAPSTGCFTPPARCSSSRSATPVVLWGGWPFFGGAASPQGPQLQHVTLIGFGVLVSYAYSAAAMLAPRMFPGYAGSPDGAAGLYFESSAMIVTLVLLGQVLELKARWRTGEAIRSLLALSPGYARRIDPDGTERDVPLDAVQPGDRLRGEAGEKVTHRRRDHRRYGVIDESMITGEALPVDKGPRRGGGRHPECIRLVRDGRPPGVGAQTQLSSHREDYPGGGQEQGSGPGPCGLRVEGLRACGPGRGGRDLRRLVDRGT